MTNELFIYIIPGMSIERKIEYSTIGRFPESKRILLIGPRKATNTTLVTKGERDEINPDSGLNWKGELEVSGKNIKGKIIFEKNANGEQFKSEGELLDFLARKYSISYLRDRSKPAVDVGT
ncbi:MAG: hypothetical protein M0P61_18165 [Ignavibacteriaceae bacterium]|nr:hypothetical protein [Ignavibacteriaceae bacterium]